jgi:thioredoxin 1
VTETNGATVELTKDTFDETVGDGLVFIDFWAAWCGPCRRFAPVFESAASRHTDITFAKVDTDDQQQLSAMYGITSIPTLVIYRDGIPVFGQPGAIPGHVLEDLIQQVQALDMDQVRVEYEKQRLEAEAQSETLQA